jgi:hypothetical protein
MAAHLSGHGCAAFTSKYAGLCPLTVNTTRVAFRCPQSLKNGIFE